jgi:hypothetical protein
MIQVPLQWSDSLVESATWEDFESPKKKFRRAPAQGQACVRVGENVNDPGTTDSDSATHRQPKLLLPGGPSERSRSCPSLQATYWVEPAHVIQNRDAI